MSRNTVALSVLVAGLALIPAAQARAETFDKLAYLTFSQSVQVPGVTLAPGTYRFRLTDTTASRNVIQVLSNDGSAVYSMFHTMPAFRMTVTDDPMVTFKETPVGVTPAIRSLFPGGESRGYEFVWWKPVDMTVMTAPQPPIFYTPMPGVEPLAEKTVERAPAAAAMKPDAAAVTRESVTEPAVAEPEFVSAGEELPATASGLPLIALLGLAGIVTGLSARQLRRHLN